MKPGHPSMNQYVLGCFYGLLGLVANVYFVLPVYGNLSLHLGEMFVIFCLVTRGLRPAVLASLLSSLGLYITTENPTFFIVSLLEILALNFLLRKGIVLLIADILFWLLIGLPITYFVIVVIYEISTQDFAHVVLLKQALNGILIVSIVSMVKPFAPASWFSKRLQWPTLKLSSRIFEVSLISIALPSLIVTLILSDSSADNAEKQTAQLLQIRVENHVDSIESHIETHKAAVDSLAHLLVEHNLLDDKKQSLLEKWNSVYSGFTTMLITDSSGNIIHGSPKDVFEKIQPLPASEKIVSDRSYSHVPKGTKKSYISGVFKGRGFGDSPIIAVSSPLLRDGDFQGVIEGSLDLPRFDGMERSNVEQAGYVVVTDHKGVVVYASEKLGLDTLEEFVVVHEKISFTNNLPVLKLSDENFLYQYQATKHGWTIFTLAEASQLIGFYKQNFFRLMIALILISILGLFFTRRFSKQITEPLESVVKSFASHKPIEQESKSVYTSKEVESVRHQLQVAQRLAVEYQDNLKGEVATKTAELVAMNEKLAQMSVEDDLTKVLNRRGFEAVANEIFKLGCRNQTPLTFAIVDIDNFKQVNDTFGHTPGDQCIVMVANEMKKSFQRETDCYARHGGDEFEVLVVGGTIERHCKMLEQLRLDIENNTIKYDGHNIRITVSIGVFSLQDDFNIEYRELVSKADKLLYECKKQGKNRIACGYQ